MTRADVINMIAQSIQDVNAERESGSQITLSEDLPLTGAGTPLDSLDFVNFTTGLEERLRQASGKEFDLAEALFDQSEPFRTVGKLADFIAD